MAHQTRDLLDAMRADCPALGETVLRVDGGMVASDWTMQCLADLLGVAVDRPRVAETTALGAAWLAGRQAGMVAPPGAAGNPHWRLDRRFLPQMDPAEAARHHAGWLDAVRRTRSGAGTHRTRSGSA